MTSGRETTDAIVALLRDQLGRVETRTMMDAVGLSLGGTLFGLITDDRLYFRTDHGNRADYDALEREAAAEGFCPGGTMPAGLSFRPVPAPVLNDAERLGRWARQAWEAGKRAGKGR